MADYTDHRKNGQPTLATTFNDRILAGEIETSASGDNPGRQ
jgi:hypothetical protein